MGTDYFIYVEAQIGNKWISIDPVVPKLHKDDDGNYDGTYELSHCHSYWNGSRSYFGETFTKLRRIGYEMKFSDMSEEVQTHWKHAIEVEGDDTDEPNWYASPVCVDYDVFCRYVDKKKFDSHGIVSKDMLFAYENGDTEELYSVDHDDFIELTPEERQAYTYHEWDEPYGWNGHFKDIYDAVYPHITDFNEENWIWDDDGIKYRLVVIEC